ncbi:unnamed protein product [Owenia fusiformis]|uniref:Uncharacterized protein n=1 Tax=Owenia fusiformis TaxID=6347 RepID=A0A8J1UGQ9_OWEFU|nr:unnamed protein product [Owenia fusiformis]
MGNTTVKCHTYSLTKDHQSSDIDRNGPCDFSYSDNGSDLVLVIEGKRLYVHRQILAKYSPVFSAMLSDDFKEREAKEIPLPGKSYKEYRELLRAVYCHGAAHSNRDKCWPYSHLHVKPETFLLHNENVYYLLSLSDEYQIDAIKDKCEEFLCLTTTQSNVTEHLYLAELYDLKKLLKTIVPIAAKISSHKLKSSPYYTHISDKRFQIRLVPD